MAYRASGGRRIYGKPFASFQNVDTNVITRVFGTVNRHKIYDVHREIWMPVVFEIKFKESGERRWREAFNTEWQTPILFDIKSSVPITKRILVVDIDLGKLD